MLVEVITGLKLEQKKTTAAVKENTAETAQVKEAAQAIPEAAAIAAKKIVDAPKPE